MRKCWVARAKVVRYVRLYEQIKTKKDQRSKKLDMSLILSARPVATSPYHDRRDRHVIISSHLHIFCFVNITLYVLATDNKWLIIKKKMVVGKLIFPTI